MTLCTLVVAHFMGLAACPPAQQGRVTCPVERTVYKCVCPDGSYYRVER